MLTLCGGQEDESGDKDENLHEGRGRGVCMGRGALLSVASKLLKDTDTRLHHLSKAEQELWNSFEKADIYEFLTGEKDTIPEFQFNWFSPEAPVVHQVPGQPPTTPPAPQAHRGTEDGELSCLPRKTRMPGGSRWPAGSGS